MISFGLLGCGRIAARHAKLLGNGEIAGARLSAVCDVAGERARQYGERFGVPAFDDPERLFAHPNIDVVSDPYAERAPCKPHSRRRARR